MGRQLRDPTAKTPWKSNPEVVRRVEGVVGKMAATRRYRDTFGPPQQQEAVERKNSDVATVETAQTSPEQPATEQQRQRQVAVIPGTSYELDRAARSYVATAGRASRASPTAMCC